MIWPCPVGGIAAGLKLAAGCRRLVRVRADAAECLPFGAAELVVAAPRASMRAGRV